MVIKEYCCVDVLSFIYFIALRDASSKAETKTNCKVLLRKFPAVRSNFLLYGATFFRSVLFHIRKGEVRLPGSVAEK